MLRVLSDWWRCSRACYCHSISSVSSSVYALVYCGAPPTPFCFFVFYACTFLHEMFYEIPRKRSWARWHHEVEITRQHSWRKHQCELSHINWQGAESGVEGAWTWMCYTRQRWVVSPLAWRHSTQLRAGKLPFYCQNNERLNTAGYYKVSYKEKVREIDPIRKLIPLSERLAETLQPRSPTRRESVHMDATWLCARK